MAVQQAAVSRQAARSADRVEIGGRLVALAGAAVFLYGLGFLITNFTIFLEVGLGPQQVGGTASGIQGYSPQLYGYVSHLQAALAGFIMGSGLMVVGLGWFGIRRRQAWAMWNGLIGMSVALAAAIPLHYVYGLATPVHVGPVYLATAVFLAGTALAWSGLRAKAA